MAGMIIAASAVSVTSGAPGVASAGLVPGSMSCTCTSRGVAPAADWTIASTPYASSVQYGAVPPRKTASSSAPGVVAVIWTSSCWIVVQSLQAPRAFFVRSWTLTSCTVGSAAQVIPTLANRAVSGWDTVSAGTPASSSPELATAPSWGSSLGAGTGVAGSTSDSGPEPTTVPSEVTTASSCGASTEPRDTESMEGSTGSACGSGAA